jgi:hypothetical protein
MSIFAATPQYFEKGIDLEKLGGDLDGPGKRCEETIGGMFFAVD